MPRQISPLRQRMIEDMTIRNMSPSTQKIYVAAVANFSIFHGRSPDRLTFEDVRGYRLHLISRGLKPNSINPIMGALRFFYRTTLGLKEVSENIPYARRADPLCLVTTEFCILVQKGAKQRLYIPNRLAG
jgi:integrase/recombinase XerD